MSLHPNVSRTFITALSDAELQGLVWDAIQADSRIDQAEVSVVVENGTIYLAGIVDSAAERKAVQEGAETVVPRDRIVDRLTLRNFVERTNEELCAAVRHAMRKDPEVCSEGLRVAASDGVVTLEGRVRNYSEKNIVESIAWWAPGVTEVISHVQVDGVGNAPDEV